MRMTHREKFAAALDRKPIEGLVPHFELVFFLTMERFGKVHPNHRNYSQWDQMSKKEQALHRNDMAGLYIDTARAYQHSAIFVHVNPDTLEERRRMLELIREKSGDEFFLLLYCDPTFAIPSGNGMMDFVCKMSDDPQTLKDEAAGAVKRALAQCEPLVGLGLADGMAMCSDYCFNTNPFVSPAQFGEFIAPYLAETIQGLRDRGFYTIKHTDGNIMPILDQLAQCNPHALHSLDPQAGVDIAVIKKLYGQKLCLVGNVNCGLLETGTDEEVVESARYALRHGMPGGGYIFSTSNCAYTGMALERYELMWNTWQKEGRYPVEQNR